MGYMNIILLSKNLCGLQSCDRRFFFFQRINGSCMVAPKQRKKEVGTIAAQEPRLNEAIRVKECRLIGYDGSQLGIYPIEQAQRIADDEGYDLLEIALGKAASMSHHGLR